MKRYEEFSQDGKNFIYIDFSGIKKITEFENLITVLKPLIAKYPKNSIHMINNIEDIRFDSKSKEIMIEYAEHNKPYIKYVVVIGLDGIKKIMIKNIFEIIGRDNVHFAFSKEKAIEWLLERD